MLKKTVVRLLLLVIGIGIGLVFNSIRESSTLKSPPVGLNLSCPYNLINPSDCSAGVRSNLRVNTDILKQKIIGNIDGFKKVGKTKRVSVYYRDLTNGQVMNIYALDNFYGGSLLKVPIMLLYYKFAEIDSTLLEKNIVIDEVIAPSQLNDASKSVKKGEAYSVEELIEKMIIYSDNSAKDVLKKNAEILLGTSLTPDSILHDMDLVESTTSSGLTTLEQYGGLFRILYNSEYLSSTMSQRALEILSKTEFDRGITAGVPQGITVANKFGIPSTESKIPQLHDCGIVYHPNNPYILCIFTEGIDYFDLEKIIIDISREIYNAVDGKK